MAGLPVVWGPVTPCGPGIEGQPVWDGTRGVTTGARLVVSVVARGTQRGGGAVIADSPPEEALFGLWLRRRRRVLDLTQKALARRVGCSPSTIRKLEADLRHPSRPVARALAEALGVAEREHDAFIRFARGGWADRPPSNAGPDFERPWIVGGRVPSSAATSGEPPQVASEPAPATDADDAGRGIPDAPHVVAREGELAWLGRELEQALAGDGRTALVAGEAGQGKTALTLAFAARAQTAHPELLVAIGTCNAYTGRGDPFLPFRQILAQLTGNVPAGRHLDAFQRERAARLSRAAPLAVRALAERGPHLLDRLVPGAALRGRLHQTASDPISIAAAGGPVFGPAAVHRNASEEQQALRAEAAEALTALADDVPLLLVLDDLHWVDDSSAELLVHLSAVAAGHRLLVLGAYRPAGLAAHTGEGHLPHPLVELARRHATSLDLAESDGRAFVDAWLDRQENVLDSDFRASLWRQTGGHPLFTIELLRAMQEGGDLIEDDDGR